MPRCLRRAHARARRDGRLVLPTTRAAWAAAYERRPAQREHRAAGYLGEVLNDAAAADSGALRAARLGRPAKRLRNASYVQANAAISNVAERDRDEVDNEVMAEASIDGIAFFDGGASTGGAFRLNEAAPKSAVERVDRWSVEVHAGSEMVVARGDGGTSYEEALDDALAAANQGLDLLCLRGEAAMAIGHAQTEHIIWWREGSQSVIRLLSTPTVTVHMGKVTVTGGTPVVPPVPQWQESARYFRLSQLSDDLFDSFRNVYLALESILDSIAPQRTSPFEGEGAWFRRALAQAGTIVDLGGHVAKGTADPIQALYDELYVSTRNLVFHAKSTRAYLLPHSSPERQAVEDTTRRAAYLYLALAEKVIHLRPPSSGIFAAFWRMQIDALVPRFGIVVTNDQATVSADDVLVNPSGGDVVELAVRRAEEYDRPFEHAFLGVGDGEAVASLEHVTRVCSTVEGEPNTAGIPEGAFRIADVDRFEALVILRARNANEPKRDFAS